METVLVVVAAVTALWLIAMAFGLGAVTLAGAVYLLDYAREQGFIGLAAYAACWVFMLPVMLIACLIIGYLITREDKK